MNRKLTAAALLCIGARTQAPRPAKKTRVCFRLSRANCGWSRRNEVNLPMVSVAAVKLPAVSQVRRGAQVASHLELAMDSYPPIYQMEPLPSFVFPTTKIGPHQNESDRCLQAKKRRQEQRTSATPSRSKVICETPLPLRKLTKFGHVTRCGQSDPDIRNPQGHQNPWNLCDSTHRSQTC
jgi:hypothetical protein